ncbi:MAG: ABC transporter permease [Candidatus Neomarinimicrobiota bacterium]|nr:MAG: ABC transporter permease [Candidatus Neomarinimicrobiota bacterium]
MTQYIAKRVIYMFLTSIGILMVGFIIIQLPPGDYVSSYVASLKATGRRIPVEQIKALRHQFGLDLPVYVQFFVWISKLFQGNLGMSLAWGRPIVDIIGERIGYTLLISSFATFLTYAIAIPIGIYSATHQYSVADYTFTAISFTAMSIPGFLFALITMVLLFKYFGISMGGVFSPQYMRESFSINKLIDLLKHMIAPSIIIGLGSTGGTIRVMRATLLDELKKNYVVTARAKGLSEAKLLFKYPVRVAINPIVSTIGWTLPYLFSGSAIVAIVLNLPTIEPLYYSALLSQDMYLAGDCLAIIGILTIIGTFISDILLMLVDPRVRFEKGY